MELVDWFKDKKLVMLSVTGDLPSVVGFFVGDNAPAKWWSHPLGNDIYNGYQALLSDKDTLQLKLVDRKVTLVHRSLWPALYRVATDQSRIEVLKLSSSAKELESLVEASGVLRLDFIEPEWPGGSKKLKRDRMELERYAVVISSDEHTEQGAHKILLESWKHFRRREKIRVKELPCLRDAISEISKFVGNHRTTLD